jgi:hypothetical protein
MANFDKMLKDIQLARDGITGMGKDLKETNKFSQGLIGGLSDLASMSTTKGSIWSAFGRLSAGTQFYVIQNRLRSITVFARTLKNIESDRIKKEAEREALLESQTMSYDKIGQNLKNINTLLNTKDKSFRDINLKMETQNKLLLRAQSAEELLLKRREQNKETLKEILKSERRVLEVVGGIDAAKANLSGRMGIDPSLTVRRRGGRFSPFVSGDNETESFVVQIAGVNDELHEFQDQFMEANKRFTTERNAKKKLNKELETENQKLKDANRERTKLRDEFTARERNRLKDLDERIARNESLTASETGERMVLLAQKEELEANQQLIEITEDLIEAKRKELENAPTDAQLEMQKEFVLNLHKEAQARKLALEVLEEEAKERGISIIDKHGVTTIADTRETFLDSLKDFGEELANEFPKITSVIVKAGQIAAKVGGPAGGMLRGAGGFLGSMGMKGFRAGKATGELALDVAKGIPFADKVGGFGSFIGGSLKKSAQKATTDKAMARQRKMFGPFLDLMSLAKEGFKKFYDKRNLSNIFMMAKTGLIVFAKIIYAVTLISLLVYILHKSGFIDGVRKFIEKMEPLFALYFEGLKKLVTGIIDILVGTFELVRALLGGGSFKDEVLPALEKIGGGLLDLTIGLLTATIGTIVMGAITILGGIISGGISMIMDTFLNFKKGVSSGVGRGLGSVSGGLMGAKIGAMFGPVGMVVGGLAGSVIGGSLGSSVGTATGKALGMKGYASGGMVSNTGLALVGERGPEIVNLPAGARVFNNQQSRNMMGGNTINVSVNGRVGASDAELDDLARKLGRKINLEMNRYNNSGYRA